MFASVTAWYRIVREFNLRRPSTHVLRHGGCRRAHNAAKDLALTQVLLGNTNTWTAPWSTHNGTRGYSRTTPNSLGNQALEIPERN